MRGALRDRPIHGRVVDHVVERPSTHDVAIGLVHGNPTVNDVLERGTASPDTVVDAVADALRRAFGDAPMRAPLQAIVFTARRSDG